MNPLVAGGVATLILVKALIVTPLCRLWGLSWPASVETGLLLAPGGELWCVWNSHLRYRPHLERLVGPTRQVARNPKFTVTVSTAR